MQLTQKQVRELLHYDPDTGIFTWLPRPRSMFKRANSYTRWVNECEGRRAGIEKANTHGYRYRTIFMPNRKFYREHRVAWIYMTGTQPPKSIDHENRDATDNRWVNIRDSKGMNQKNLSMPINNTSGVTGVYYDKQRSLWCARGWLSGRHKYLGRFEKLEDAEHAVTRFRADNGYSPDHGKNIAIYHG